MDKNFEEFTNFIENLSDSVKNSDENYFKT
jgi:hypothetical protein